ncbi:MAG: hypothetical protein HQL82_14775 [Magnetococcales bacterium]|nr:hypothetical protein [Magnetococcales bacterium]
MEFNKLFINGVGILVVCLVTMLSYQYPEILFLGLLGMMTMGDWRQRSDVEERTP